MTNEDEKANASNNAWTHERRRFFLAAGHGLLLVGWSACGTGGTTSAAAGDEGDGGGGGGGQVVNPDGGPDAANTDAGECALANSFNAGPANAIVAEQALSITKDNERYFLCSGQSGPYGLSATCPHNCCNVDFEATKQQFVCPCHGSVFAYDGTNISGPANGVALQHLDVCVDANGDALVEVATILHCAATPSE